MIRMIGLASLFFVAIGSFAATPDPSVGAPEERMLTLYSDGVAFVRESRRVVLGKGVHRVTVAQLPIGIDSTSLRIESERVVLLEVIEGARVAPIEHPNPMGFTRQDRSSGHAALKHASVFVGGSDASIAMEWVLEVGRATQETITVTYLARSIRYSANLDVVLDSSGHALLEGWVSIENRAGPTFEDARILLVTSPISRVPSRSVPAFDAIERRREVELPETVTLPAGQRHRVRVLSRRVELGPDRIVAEGGRLEEHEARLGPDSLMARRELGAGRVRAERRRRLSRSDRDALIRALPPLVRRVYSQTSDGMKLLAEENLDPVAMSSDLTLGPAADIEVNRRQLGFKRRESGEVEETLEVIIINHRSQSIEVEIIERLFRSKRLEIAGSSHSIELRDDLHGPVGAASLSVPAQDQAKLTFTVVYRP